MRIGIVGTGRIGGAIAHHAARSGYEVTVSNGRGPDSLRALVDALGPNAIAGTTEQAARADVVFLCIVWELLPQVLPTLGPWENRIVVDTTNPYVRSGEDFVLLDMGSSTSSEKVQSMVPGARLVKAFNSMPADVLADDPRQGSGHRVAFVSGDDPSAKREVIGIADRMGFAPIDLGTLATGGRMQQAGSPLAGLNLIRL